jgi:hypothetical protein
MDAIATQIQNLAKAADEAGRKKVLDALRDLETPYDVLQRFAGLVSELISINMTYGDLVAHL